MTVYQRLEALTTPEITEALRCAREELGHSHEIDGVTAAMSLIDEVRWLLTQAKAGEDKGLGKTDNTTIKIGRGQTAAGPAVELVSSAFADAPGNKIILKPHQVLVIDGTDRSGAARLSVRNVQW